nr:MAG TPA: hypothetical protein [Crassvirales sp.]
MDFANNQFQLGIDEMYSIICQNNWNDSQIVREFKTKRYKFF